MARPMIIGVAGGSGSGKTTVVRKIVRRLGPDQVCVIQHDSYYFDRDVIIPEGGHNRVGVDMLIARIEAIVGGQVTGSRQ